MASKVVAKADAKVDVRNTAQETPIPVPTALWCNWQALKGTNPRNLFIPDVDLIGKWVILTGGNSGIGREAALQFAKWGANIILGCREPPAHEMHPEAAVELIKKGALTAGHSDTVVEWWECDMSSLDSVQTFGKRWLATERPLDILCNNAGIGGQGAKVQLTVDGFELLHQVNFISHVLLTVTLLPSLAKSAHPRIVCTTSCMQYSGTFALTNANAGDTLSYSHNKLYFQTWLTELQHRMSASRQYPHVVINGVHPGFVNSQIWTPMAFLPPRSWAHAAARRVLGVLLKWVAISEQQGSLAILNAATGERWKVGGRYANRIREETPMPQTRNSGCRRRVWEFVNGELRLGEKGLLGGLGE